ncbi:Peroxisomal (S)-2-hydroxy-acid oxidase GLO4, partial [Cucurbita argyrosperma subsp. sororia]
MSSKPVNVNDFKELARSSLPKTYYDFYAGGAEDEHTLRENIRAFHSITIRPRVLVDVSQIDISTTVFGHRISVPILVAPTSAHMLAFHEGELATARAAASAQAIKEVAASCDAVRFFQLYVFKRCDITDLIVQRAETCGYKAIVVTLDTPWLGRREADMKNNRVSMLHISCIVCIPFAGMIAYPKKNLEGLMSVEINSEPGVQLNFCKSNCGRIFILERYKVVKMNH